MSDHELLNIIATADAGRCVTGQAALREAFIAIVEHFSHTLRVSQEEMLVIAGAGTALVLAKTRVHATLKGGELYDVLRRATYVFRSAVCPLT